MTRQNHILSAAALIALGLGTSTMASAQNLDQRAASQRACLNAAHAEGYSVHALSRPTPIMGRLGKVRGERVRLQVATSGGAATLSCSYHIDDMSTRLRFL